MSFHHSSGCYLPVRQRNGKPKQCNLVEINHSVAMLNKCSLKKLPLQECIGKRLAKQKKARGQWMAKLGAWDFFARQQQAAATMQATKTKRDKMAMCNYQTLSSNQSSWRQHFLFPISLACIGRLLKQIWWWGQQDWSESIHLFPASPLEMRSQSEFPDLVRESISFSPPFPAPGHSKPDHSIPTSEMASRDNVPLQTWIQQWPLQ